MCRAEKFAMERKKPFCGAAGLLRTGGGRDVLSPPKIVEEGFCSGAISAYD